MSREMRLETFTLGAYQIAIQDVLIGDYVGRIWDEIADRPEHAQSWGRVIKVEEHAGLYHITFSDLCVAYVGTGRKAWINCHRIQP